MNLLQRFFKKELSSLEKHELELINKVIELLKEKPCLFSSRWFTGKSLDRSVKSIDGTNILILSCTGEIIKPIEPKMSKKQKLQVKKLLVPIIERDSKYVINKLISSNHE